MGIRRKALRRAVFLDRDGVLNDVRVEAGRPYPPKDPAEVVIPGDVAGAIQLLKSRGFKLAVITNQPDVARGTQTRTAVEAINASLMERLPLDHVEVCFHDDADHCDCRKPLPGLIYRAAKALQCDASGQFVVGDRWRDIDAGRAAGCRTVWIDRKYAEKAPEHYDYRAETFAAAAGWIVKQCDEST